MASSDIVVYKRDDLNLPLQITDYTSTPSVPFDITGYTVYFTVKTTADKSTGDSNAIIALDITDHTNPTQGQTLISVSHTITDTIDEGYYLYDVRMKSPANFITTLLTGNIYFSNTVTDRV